MYERLVEIEDKQGLLFCRVHAYQLPLYSLAIGQVVVPRYAVSRPKYYLVMELIENPQGLQLPSLTFANSL